MVAGTGSSHGAAAPAWLKAAPILFLLLWSGGFAFARIGVEHAPPMTLLALRYWFAIVVLLVVLAILRPPVPHRARDWGHLMVVGALVQGLYFSFSYLGFWLGVSAGTMAIIVSLQPILVGLLAPQFVAEHVGLARWAGARAGAHRRRHGHFGALRSRGDVGRRAVVRRRRAGVDDRRHALREALRPQSPPRHLQHHAVSGGLRAGPAARAFGGAHGGELDGEFAVALAYLVIGNSLIAVTLLLAMIRHGEAARVSALLFMVPPMAALIAWGLIGEAMPPAAWAGMAVAAAGVALATRKLRVRRRAITEV
jgi:drug/metabolite transporter (DMT)-like permease